MSFTSLSFRKGSLKAAVKPCIVRCKAGSEKCLHVDEMDTPTIFVMYPKVPRGTISMLCFFVLTNSFFFFFKGLFYTAIVVSFRYSPLLSRNHFASLFFDVAESSPLH